MKFSKILGKCDPKIIELAEENISSILIELAMDYSRTVFGSKLGGDIFLHQMVSTLPHICDARAIEFESLLLEIENNLKEKKTSEEEKSQFINDLQARLGKTLLYTAATSGKEYLWNPEFVNKQSKIGLRLVIGHEGWHAIYMHPSRRGSRNPALFNISVDFKVNYTLIDDLRLRKIHNPVEVFQKELGEFITLEEYASFLKDPFNPPDKLIGWSPIHALKKALQPAYKDPTDVTGKTYFYAEPNLSKEMRLPENIYDYLIGKIPKCKCCGRLGAWKKPAEYKKLLKQADELIKDKCSDTYPT